jgi:hypothetical protein
MKRSFGQTAKAVGGGALLGVFCTIGLGVMVFMYSTPVINLEAMEPTLGEGMTSCGVMMLLFPFALWLGLIAGFQQAKGRPTLKRLLWGLFLGILFSGFLVSAATTEEVANNRALQGTDVTGGRFRPIPDSTNEEWLEQPVRVSRKPWFSRPLVVVGPVLGLLLGLIVPRRLRPHASPEVSELAADPTRIKREADPSRIWKQLFLFLTGCFLLGLAMFLSTRGFGPIILLVLFPAFLLKCYIRTKSAPEPNPDDSRRVSGPELKAGGTKAARSPLVALSVHVSKLLGFGLAVLFFVFIAAVVASSFVFGGPEY